MRRTGQPGFLPFSCLLLLVSPYGFHGSCLHTGCFALYIFHTFLEQDASFNTQGTLHAMQMKMLQDV